MLCFIVLFCLLWSSYCNINILGKKEETSQTVVERILHIIHDLKSIPIFDNIHYLELR